MIFFTRVIKNETGVYVLKTYMQFFVYFLCIHVLFSHVCNINVLDMYLNSRIVVLRYQNLLENTEHF